MLHEISAHLADTWSEKSTWTTKVTEAGKTVDAVNVNCSLSMYYVTNHRRGRFRTHTKTFMSITQTFPCIMQRFLKAVKMIIFRWNFWYFSYFYSKYRLWVHAEVVLTSTHNLCFRAKIRRKCIPLYTPVLLYKSGVYWLVSVMGKTNVKHSDSDQAVCAYAHLVQERASFCF